MVLSMSKEKSINFARALFYGTGLGIGLIQPLGIFIVTEQLGLSKRVYSGY